MDISERQMHWGNTSKYWMNIGLSFDDDGKIKFEVIKHTPNMTTFGMPGYDEQVAFHIKMEKIQNKICKSLKDIEHNFNLNNES